MPHRTCHLCRQTFLSPLAHQPHTGPTLELERLERKIQSVVNARAVVVPAPPPSPRTPSPVMCGECFERFDTTDLLWAHIDACHQ